MCARSRALKVTAGFWRWTTAAAHLQRGKAFSKKYRGGISSSHPHAPACKASSAFVPHQMTPWWVDLIIHTCVLIHNAIEIPGLWQHLTWTAHSNVAHQQALGKKSRRLLRGKQCSRTSLIHNDSTAYKWVCGTPLLMRKAPKQVFNFKAMLKAHYHQSDCMKSSPNFPEQEWRTALGAKMLCWVDLSMRLDLHICLKNLPNWGHSTEYLNTGGSQKHFTTFIPQGKFN